MRLAENTASTGRKNYAKIAMRTVGL